MALSEKKDNGGNPLELHTDYSMLGLPDLLLARERNHLELMRKENVVGTAVGLYLIRRSDPWPPAKAPKSRNARTLANSEVRPYSWPCILVFVDKWDDEKNINWENMVPKSLYLEDGRKVPVCVVEAPPAIQGQPVMRNVVFPSTHMGGGFPVLIESQGREHVASIGCLLSDGHTTYALTNRHVTGEAGTPVTTRIGGAQVQLGTSDSRQLTRKPFQEIYPGWAGKSVYLTLDVGLIRIDDLTNWTAQVFGLGTLGEIADLGMDNLTLRLIDCPVRAYGCASGPLKGDQGPVLQIPFDGWIRIRLRFPHWGPERKERGCIPDSPGGFRHTVVVGEGRGVASTGGAVGRNAVLFRQWKATGKLCTGNLLEHSLQPA
jgi:hypothetical protein